MNTNLMADFMNWLAGLWADWALAASWQIALLVTLVALVALASRHMSARFRYLLWMLVLIKPVTSAPAVSAVQLDDPSDDLVGESATPMTQGDVAPTPDAQPAARRPAWSLSAVALAVWLAGFGLFTLFIAVRYLRLTRMLGDAAEVDEGPLRVVLERLAMRLGRSDPPALLLSDAVSSPFLFGLLRPRIVLPAGLPGALETGQIEDVLLQRMRPGAPLWGIAAEGFAGGARPVGRRHGFSGDIRAQYAPAKTIGGNHESGKQSPAPGHRRLAGARALRGALPADGGGGDGFDGQAGFNTKTDG